MLMFKLWDSQGRGKLLPHLRTGPLSLPHDAMHARVCVSVCPEDLVTKGTGWVVASARVALSSSLNFIPGSHTPIGTKTTSC